MRLEPLLGLSFALVLGVETTQWGRLGGAPDRSAALQRRIDRATEGDTLRLAPGIYTATPTLFMDPLCGNCLDPFEGANASIGFRISGKRLALIGSGPESTTLVTSAGYGLYLEDSDVLIRDLSVTGGKRDPDGRASDGAVVVRRSRARLENLHLRDNTDRARDVVVGIAGLVGREGAEIDVRSCRILNNGWDGVALYRGAVAVIADNVIEQGRGAGVGITWDATAIVMRNRVSGYWKGIGTFGQSRAIVRNNAVFDNLGWGIIATGDSDLEATHNVIVRNGNCGFAVWSESATGLAANNIIADNGWRQEWVCPRVGIWHAGESSRFPVTWNATGGNAAGDWRSELGEAVPDRRVAPRPLFRGPVDFRLPKGSPLIDAGDTTRTDRDGTRSDLGLTGGPFGTTESGAPPPRLVSERLRVGSEAWFRSRAGTPRQ